MNSSNFYPYPDGSPVYFYYEETGSTKRNHIEWRNPFAQKKGKTSPLLSANGMAILAYSKRSLKKALNMTCTRNGMRKGFSINYVKTQIIIFDFLNMQENKTKIIYKHVTCITVSSLYALWNSYPQTLRTRSVFMLYRPNSEAFILNLNKDLLSEKKYCPCLLSTTLQKWAGSSPGQNISHY